MFYAYFPCMADAANRLFILSHDTEKSSPPRTPLSKVGMNDKAYWPFFQKAENLRSGGKKKLVLIYPLIPHLSRS